MRILYWADGFWPLIGGLEVLSMHFLRRLRERGHEIEVITTTVTTPATCTMDIGFPVHRFPFIRVLQQRDIKKLRAICGEIIRIKQAFRPDVEHVNVAFAGSFYYLRTQAMHRAPMLAVMHALLPFTSAAGGLQDQAVRASDWVVSVSDAVQNGVLATAPDVAARASVIHNGLPMPARSPSPISFAPPRLLCLGRLVEDKGFDVAVAAFAQVRHRFPDATLTIVGDGPVREALRQQATDLGLGDAVHLPGWASPDQTAELIDRATAVVMPSRWEEPFGLVAVEAAQMARPIVATRVGGLPEIVVDGETGLLVAKDDAAGMAAAIVALLTHPERAARMGQAARMRARQRFDLDRCVAEYEGVYERIVAGAGAAAVGDSR